ncbi:MAG: hypothetical protein MK538_12335, partial [Planctomycetes bacterium]|nr:hypothetical protein [Planctomycetota bacterium]
MNPRLGRSPKIDPHKLIGEKRQIQAAIVTTLVVAVLNGLSSQGFSTPPSPFSGVQSGWAIPLVRGGELVELEWNAAAPSGDGPSLIHHSHLRSKEDAATVGTTGRSRGVSGRLPSAPRRKMWPPGAPTRGTAPVNPHEV